MGFLRTSTRLMCLSGMTIAAVNAPAFGQGARSPVPALTPVYNPAYRVPTAAPAYAPVNRAPGVMLAKADAPAAAPAPVYSEPAPAYTYGEGCATGSCATGTCNTSNGNPASFAPNKGFHCKDGCKPYCATTTFPHSDWHYIKHFCGPSLIPDGCNNAYGHFNTTWRRWEDIAPGWQPNNDATCNRGCTSPIGCQPGAGEYYLPGNTYPGSPAPIPAPEMIPPMSPPMAPTPLPAPTPVPMPLPSPTPNPTAPIVPILPAPMPVPPTGLSLAPAPLPPNVIVVQATPAQVYAPVTNRPANIRVEEGRILRNPLAAPNLLPAPEVEEIVAPASLDRSFRNLLSP